MKLPISKLLVFLSFFAAVPAVQGQTAKQKAACEEAVKEHLRINLSELEAGSLKLSVEALASVEAIAHLAANDKLVALQRLAPLASLPPFPEMPLQTGPAKSTEADPNAQPAFSITKVKKIDRSFKVDRSDKLAIENQFGRVEVQTWARNEMAVEVTIISRAATDEKAQEILDKINVRINEDRGNNLISFTTEREPMQIRSSSEKAFEINYLVKMPKANPLKVSNKYGTVQVPDLDGPTELEVQYGKLTAGRLNNARNKVQVSYSGGECQVDYMKGGDLNVKYSRLHLTAADDIKTSTGYSNIAIDKVETLTIESRYDSKFLLGSVGQITGNGSYSGIKIGSLKESASLNMKYCSGFEIANVASNFKNVNLTAGYTGMALGFADNSAFNFEVDTQFGSLKMDQDLANFSFKEVRNTSSSYKGKYGKSSPKGTVNVTSRYGSVAFQ
ncbi:hypothetical protein [Rufibacter radiotolerans]|uniref:hypothetical protein n=1 Tax=Rufibacter radiotolerans TaxID=1379910 RepID=UPI000B2CCFFF|nr:hypothetical protein [Rufibacter radiotolerans]